MSDQLSQSLSNLIRRNQKVTPDDIAAQKQAKKDLLKVKAIAKLSQDLGVADPEAVKTMDAVIAAVDSINATTEMLRKRLKQES